MKFESYEDLKLFLDEIYSCLRALTFGAPLTSYSPTGGLDANEKSMITTIYNSYRRGKGIIIKQIAASFHHLLQLLIPSHRYSEIFKELIYLEYAEHRQKLDTSKKLYRDHILHSANVCWVGHRLIFHEDVLFYGHLKECLKKILPPEYLRIIKTEEDWEGFITITWFITAMVHDFGYPVELIERKYTDKGLFACGQQYFKTDELLNYVEDHFPRSADLYRDLVEKINPQLLKNPFHCCGKAHPIVGSFELLHFLDEHYDGFEDKRKIYRCIYQLAALGIFEHHKKGEIDFRFNPFGYILVLADTIHEWHRYVCTGMSGKDDNRPEFVSPVRGVTISKEGANRYGVSFRLAYESRRKKCTGWDSSFFLDGKEKEFMLLKQQASLPSFFVVKS